MFKQCKRYLVIKITTKVLFYSKKKRQWNWVMLYKTIIWQIYDVSFKEVVNITIYIGKKLECKNIRLIFLIFYLCGIKKIKFAKKNETVLAPNAKSGINGLNKKIDLSISDPYTAAFEPLGFFHNVHDKCFLWLENTVINVMTGAENRSAVGSRMSKCLTTNCDYVYVQKVKTAPWRTIWY